MTTPTVARQPGYPIASEHLEELSRGLSVLTVDPCKSALYYFFPLIGAFFSNYYELRLDRSLEGIMPWEQTSKMLKEIENLTEAAGIRRKVIPYTALNHQFSSSGGSYSLTSPSIFIPEQHLFRRAPLSPFPEERPEENLQQKTWIFSDDEVRFLIARELGQIKENSVLLRIAIKVSILAAMFTIFATSFSWTVGLGLFVTAVGFYIVSERFLRQRADLVGVEILGKRIENPVQVAIRALEKIRQQNLYRLKESKLAKWYITESGNNVLDFIHPFLTTRIEALKKCGRKF